MLNWSCCVAAMLILLALPMCAQGPRPVGLPSQPPMYATPGIDLPSTTNRPSTQFERQAQIQMEHDRQLALKRDTDKLLEMATDLKQSVDRTNAGILSVDVIKRAQEIEKLAKSVREKMKGN
jgi:hypothetical protein